MLSNEPTCRCNCYIWQVDVNVPVLVQVSMSNGWGAASICHAVGHADSQCSHCKSLQVRSTFRCVVMLFSLTGSIDVTTHYDQSGYLVSKVQGPDTTQEGRQ